MNTYNVKNYNISTSAMKDVETDPELAKKIPQFNRSEPRFLELKKMGIKNIFVLQVKQL